MPRPAPRLGDTSVVLIRLGIVLAAALALLVPLGSVAIAGLVNINVRPWHVPEQVPAEASSLRVTAPGSHVTIRTGAVEEAMVVSTGTNRTGEAATVTVENRDGVAHVAVELPADVSPRPTPPEVDITLPRDWAEQRAVRVEPENEGVAITGDYGAVDARSESGIIDFTGSATLARLTNGRPAPLNVTGSFDRLQLRTGGGNLDAEDIEVRTWLDVTDTVPTAGDLEAEAPLDPTDPESLVRPAAPVAVGPDSPGQYGPDPGEDFLETMYLGMRAGRTPSEGIHVHADHSNVELLLPRETGAGKAGVVAYDFTLVSPRGTVSNPYSVQDPPAAKPGGPAAVPIRVTCEHGDITILDKKMP